ncbi:antiviral innate immune response receptor RIG-I-like [Mytilus trossulus]|uniref:antiviral innate immune response receptor RIG-I-like n=1 Tax=Mytilus trossulus TaxID=6551 RepID=UPI0030048BB0
MATSVDEFCNLCKVSFTSAKNANDHYEGRTHKNALTGESELFCDLCKIKCSCLESMNAHLEGKSHKRKEQEAMLSSVVNDENVIKDESGDGFCCKLCDIKCSGIENINVHLQGKSHKKKEMQVNIESPEGYGSPKEKSDGSLLYCEICQVSISGSDNMKLHVEGKGHKKKQLQQSNSHGDEKSKTINDGNVDGNNGENDDSIYVDAQQTFDHEHKTVKNDLSGQSDKKDEPNIIRDRISSSDEDNVGQEIDQTFVKNILESFEGGKYSKSIDHKDNLSLPLNQAVNKDFKSLNSSSNYSNKNKIEGKNVDTTFQKINNSEIIHDNGCSLDVSTTTKNTMETNTSTKSIENKASTSSVSTKKDDLKGTQNTPSRTTVRMPKRQQNYHCVICNQLMNTEKAYKDHLQGKNHGRKLLAPDRVLPETVFTEVDITEVKTKSRPRKYQEELFRKAMKKDAICFLPTGTGKTLIGCMVMSTMLEQNPTRQVVFLVERGLLVLQQFQYIKKELGATLFTRFGLQDLYTTERRKLLIAGLCSGSQSSRGVPLWKHDVIVVTAAYYENLLQKKLLRWKDTCLVVFDEVHHCVKSHPYNRLSYFEHKECPTEDQPKLLGLTASPAGKSTVEQTVKMLEELTINVGGVSIEIVEDNESELNTYRSNAEIDIQTVSLNSQEERFKSELQVYILHCYKKMADVTNLLEHSDAEELKLVNKNDREFRQLADEKLDGKMLNYLKLTIGLSEPCVGASPQEKVLATNLIKHSHYICVTLDILLQFGMEAAVEELKELMGLDKGTSFEFARKLELPCSILTEMVSRIICQENQQDQIDDGKFTKLVDLLINPETINLLKDDKSLILILVKERGSAFKMNELLQDKIMSVCKGGVSALVGHGTTSGKEPGMKVTHQKVILDNIQQHKYNIVVATSVAEEGIDIPECELVITLNPPSNVTALVQMRGRARKNQSKFIVVCNSTKEREDMEDLLKREQNMMEAVKQLSQS